MQKETKEDLRIVVLNVSTMNTLIGLYWMLIAYSMGATEEVKIGTVVFIANLIALLLQIRWTSAKAPENK